MSSLYDDETSPTYRPARTQVKIFQASVELSATPTVKCTYLLYGEKERVIVAGRGGDVNGNSCLRRLRPGSHQTLFEEIFDFKVRDRWCG